MDKTLFEEVFNDFLNVNADEEKLLKRTSLLSPRPFTYLLNESALSNRLIAGKSKVEGSSMMKLEQNELETSERREMEIKNGTMRGGTTDVSSRIQSTLSSNSKSAYVTSRLSVRQCFSSKMVTGTLLKNEECSTSTEKRSAVEESLVFSKGLPKKRFSLNSRRNVESSIDRLVRHFDSTLYQNYFFLEEGSHSLGQNRMPVHQDACSHKPLAIEMLKNQETHEHNLEVPQSPDLETETNVSKSNSKVLKDLVEPQQTSRKLWSHMPQVKASGYLEKATTAQQHLQEAKFEVITSEASYYRSLVILETHFALRLTNVMTKAQHKFIFGHVKKVRKVSESVLTALSKCFENNILMTNMCHILYDLVKDNFQIYITYCKNQPLIEKTLEEVRKEPQFEKALHHLELEPVCQNLNLPSFLILPMQRFLRMPLLVDSILKKLNTQDIEYKTWEKLLKYLKKKAEECNNACGELDKIAKQYIIIRELANSLQFVKGIPPLALQSSSRSLLLQDTFSILSLTESVATEVGSIRLTLLSDYLILAKPVGSKHYQVITYCKKDKASIKAGEGTYKKRFIVLKLAANYKGESERWFLGFEDVKKCEVISKNWMEALPPSNDDSSDDEHLKIKQDGKKTVRKSTGTSGRGNKLVKVIYEFGAKKLDELELKPGEFISVKSRNEDGWCYGERVRDGKGGWFPENYTSLVSQAEQIEKTLQRELV